MDMISQHKLDLIVHPGSGERLVTFEVGEKLDVARSRSRSLLFRCKVRAGVFHCQHHTGTNEDPVDEGGDVHPPAGTNLETQDDQLEEEEEDGEIQSSSPSSDCSDGELEDCSDMEESSEVGSVVGHHMED